MSPVIRISDEVFARLQQLAQPLVDTPNSVIARLVGADHAEISSATGDAAESPRGRSVRVPTGFGLYLAPASIENVAVSITSQVSVQSAMPHLDDAAKQALLDAVGSRTGFHCWAMTESNLGTFQKMKRGDVVLLSVKNSGRFDYRGTVAGKFESATLGNALWPVSSGHPWSLIYVLDDVRSIEVKKGAMNAELGYDRGYRVPGVIRVNADFLRAAIARHGSLDEVLVAASR